MLWDLDVIERLNECACKISVNVHRHHEAQTPEKRSKSSRRAQRGVQWRQRIMRVERCVGSKFELLVGKSGHGFARCCARLSAPGQLQTTATPTIMSQGELRRRKVSDSKKEDVSSRPSVDDARTKEEVVWGKTPSGEGAFLSLVDELSRSDDCNQPVFRVPTTQDVLTLFHPAYPKTHIDILNLTLLGLQLALFYFLPRHIAKGFFLFYFAFWRLAYDAGLGWVLTKQSKKKWVLRLVQRYGWLDEKRRPHVRNWIRNQLSGKMGKDYSFDVRCSRKIVVLLLNECSATGATAGI